MQIFEKSIIIIMSHIYEESFQMPEYRLQSRIIFDTQGIPFNI